MCNLIFTTPQSPTVTAVSAPPRSAINACHRQASPLHRGAFPLSVNFIEISGFLGSMWSSTPTALTQVHRKGTIYLKGEGGYILFCVSKFCATFVENIPSKDVYVFFILRRRVQRYRTAVRGVRIKNTYTDSARFYACIIKYTPTRRCTILIHFPKIARSAEKRRSANKHIFYLYIFDVINLPLSKLSITTKFISSPSAAFT